MMAAISNGYKSYDIIVGHPKYKMWFIGDGIGRTFFTTLSQEQDGDLTEK